MNIQLIYIFKYVQIYTTFLGLQYIKRPPLETLLSPTVIHTIQPRQNIIYNLDGLVLHIRGSLLILYDVYIQQIHKEINTAKFVLPFGLFNEHGDIQSLDFIL